MLYASGSVVAEGFWVVLQCGQSREQGPDLPLAPVFYEADGSSTGAMLRCRESNERDSLGRAVGPQRSYSWNAQWIDFIFIESDKMMARIEERDDFRLPLRGAQVPSRGKVVSPIAVFREQVGDGIVVPLLKRLIEAVDNPGGYGVRVYRLVLQ